MKKQEADMAKRMKTGGFADPRDGKEYKTVKIGDQTWLAENLSWEGAGVWYNNSPMFGNLYGRLYTWKEALTVAPPGWHLPADEEWQKLVDFAGGAATAAEALKSEDWDGTDAFGFSALPGGYCYGYDGFFYNIGDCGSWWSATEKNSEYAYLMCIYSGDAKACRLDYCKNNAFSVRLVRD
jgi:uncharacterized protein (TIGR02145 family)